MKKYDYSMLGLLFILAIYIWIRDLSWLSSAGDVLPIITAILIFLWLGRPWRFSVEDGHPNRRWLFISGGLFILGVVTNLTLSFTISWMMLLWYWLLHRLKRDRLHLIKRLLVFPLLAFPWLFQDGHVLGWWFRLSNAWATARVFALMGFDVLHEGTQLFVEGLPISVGAPCSGLNILQSMLIAGSFLAYVQLGSQTRYWMNLIFLVAIAWLANILRIVTISVAALTLSPEFALGLFHTWGGLLVIVLMFVLCWMLFSLQTGGNHTPSLDHANP